MLNKKVLSIGLIALCAAAVSLLTAAFGCGSSSGGSDGPPPLPAALTPLSWTGFRGSDGNGVTTGTYLTSWDDTQPAPNGVKWTAGIALRGASSPVVAGEKIFLTGADDATRQVYCYSTVDGGLLWSTTVSAGTSAGQIIWNDITAAANTVVTDGVYVIAAFGNGDIAALDHNGVIRWVKKLGLPFNGYGHASSLVLYGDLVIVQMDQDPDTSGANDESRSRLIALNKTSGAIAWELADTNRPVAASWATPLIINDGSKDQLITCGGKLAPPNGSAEVFAYNPLTGAEYWNCETLGVIEVAVTPAYVNGYVIVVGVSGDVFAIDPAGSGTVSVSWTASGAGSGDGSGIVGSGTELFVVQGSTTNVSLLNSGTGADTWGSATQLSAAATVLSTPVMAGSNVYVQRVDGVMEIFTDNAGSFQSVGTGILTDADCSATPAFADGFIYIRGQDTLYCIGN